jgi:hypothetical protein
VQISDEALLGEQQEHLTWPIPSRPRAIRVSNSRAQRLLLLREMRSNLTIRQLSLAYLHGISGGHVESSFETAARSYLKLMGTHRCPGT